MVFFSNKKDEDIIIDSLDLIESYIKKDINKIGENNKEVSKKRRVIFEKIKNISKYLEEEHTKDLKVYGEIMLACEKISDGYLVDRVKSKTENVEIQYIANTINDMSKKLDDNFLNIVQVLENYSNEDYRQKVDEDIFRGGKLKDLLIGLNFLRDKISKTLTNNKKRSLMLEESSKSLAIDSQKLSEESLQQAAAIEEVSAAIEEITSNIKNNREVSENMARSSSILKDGITKGMEFAKDTTKSIDDINKSTDEVNSAIEIISQIAFQTNILSLNAAVEAATAGEAGKGFAVVAGEVRNLANKSAEAATQIGELMGDLKSKTDSGQKIVHKMTDGYNELNEKIEHTIELIDDVTHSSKEQEENIALINESIQSIDKNTQENSQISERVKEIASKSYEISKEFTASINKAKFNELR